MSSIATDPVPDAFGHFGPYGGRFVPETLMHPLQELQEELGLSGVLMEPNVGGLLSPERLDHSIRLFGQEVAPQLPS